ncbi:MAG: hypothetical protein KDE14_10665, partial [Rhodobacteraceae bacterium]|nr:hypothetical protein [Paracoccaceae bacterium]
GKPPNMAEEMATPNQEKISDDWPEMVRILKSRGASQTQLDLLSREFRAIEDTVSGNDFFAFIAPLADRFRDKSEPEPAKATARKSPLETRSGSKHMLYAYRELGRWDLVCDTARHVLKFKADDYGTLMHLADGLLMSDQYGDAIATYESALKCKDLPTQDREYIDERIADSKLLIGLREIDPASPPASASSQVPDVVEIIPPLDTRPEGSGEDGDASTPRPGPTFVFFHIDSKVGHVLGALGGKAGADAVDYRESLELAVQSVRHNVNGSQVVLLTDEATDVSALPAFDRIVRLTVNAETIMYSRMQAYALAAKRGLLHGQTYFLDTDIYTNRAIDRETLDKSDIVLTYRNGPGFRHMPVNEGVIVAADGSSPATAKFFEICLELYERLARSGPVRQRYNFDIRKWRGGQLSLAAFVKWTVPPYIASMTEIEGIHVRFLPCDEYNYPVQREDNSQTLAGKSILHFKGGPAKTWMDQYARFKKAARTAQ